MATEASGDAPETPNDESSASPAEAGQHRLLRGVLDAIEAADDASGADRVLSLIRRHASSRGRGATPTAPEVGAVVGELIEPLTTRLGLPEPARINMQRAIADMLMEDELSLERLNRLWAAAFSGTGDAG